MAKGSEAGGVRVGRGAGGTGAVAVIVVACPGGVQMGVGEAAGRPVAPAGVALGCAVAVPSPTTIPNS